MMSLKVLAVISTPASPWTALSIPPVGGLNQYQPDVSVEGIMIIIPENPSCFAACTNLLSALW